MSDLTLGLRIRVNADGSVAVINGVGNAVQGVGHQAQQTESAIGRLSSSIARVGHYAAGAFAGTWIGGKAAEVVRLADQMTLLDSRVKIASASNADYKTSAQELVAISLRTGTAFEANATIFSRINKAMLDMGGTSRDTTRLTETLAQSLRISGAAGGEAASVIRQLSQALASGVLRGDEFNSLMENSPRLAAALAAGLNTNIGVLRKMAEAGELSSGKVIAAIQSQAAVIDAEYKKIPLTVGAAMENVRTAFGQYILEANKGAGATAGLAGFINGLAGNLAALLNVTVTVGKVLAGYFTASIAAGFIAYIQSVQMARLHTEALAVEATRTAAAIVAAAQAGVASATAHAADAEAALAEVAATQAVIAAARAQAMAQLAATAQTIAQAQATIAATAATVQSTSVIYINAQATATLTAAQASRAAIITDLAMLGRQQTAVETALATATTAQAQAANAAAVAAGRLAAVSGTGAANAGLLARAVGFLGGPVGVITTLLGFGVTAWLLWGGTAKKELSDVEVKAEQTAAALEARQVSLMDKFQGAWAAMAQSAQEASGLTQNEWAAAMAAAGVAADDFATFATNALDRGWANIKAAAALVANHLIGTFVGVGRVIGETFAIMAINVGRSLDNTIASAKAAAADLAAAAQLDFSFSNSKAIDLKPLIKGGAAGLSAIFDEAFNGKYVESFGAKAEAAAAKINARRNAATADKTAAAALDTGNQDYHAHAATIKAEAAKLKTIEVMTEQHHLKLKQLNGQFAVDSKAALIEIGKAQGDYDKALAGTDKARITQSGENLRLSQKIFEGLTTDTMRLIAAENDEFAKFSEAQAKAAGKAAAAAEKKAEAVAKGIAKELAALDDQHKKLTLSERDYYAQSDALKGMSFAVKAVALAKWDIVKAAEAEKKSNDSAKSQLDALKDKYDQLTLSAEAYFAKKTTAELGPEKAAPLIRQNTLNTQAEAGNTRAADTVATLDAYNKALDDATVKTTDLAAVSSSVFSAQLGGVNLLTSAYATMAEALDANTQKLAENRQMQLLNESTADPAKKAANAAKYAKQEAKLNTDNIKLQLTGASQIAGAAAKMFDQKSSAAKAFHAVEVALSAARLVMDAKEIASSILKTGKSIVAGAAKMFEQSGWLGFAGVAAMLAAMAALGFAVSGGGGGDQQPPKTDDGTGTVLGDSTAKSESIDKTYELLKRIHAEEYAELRGINRGVASLRGGIADVVTRLFQAGGLKDFATLAQPKNVLPGGNKYGSPIHQAVVSFLFGGKQTQSITGSGISTDAISMFDVMSGGSIGARQFAQIETKTKGGLFRKGKVSYSTQFSELDEDVSQALTSVFSSMGDTMRAIAGNLGATIGKDLGARVTDYIVPAMKVELRGLSAEDASKKLSNVISAALDTMATAVFGDIIAQYQKLGEGMLETAVRIVAEVAVVKDALAVSGLSLAANAIAISDALVQAAGGLEGFQNQFEGYYDKFYTDAEKQVRLQTNLTDQLAESLIVLPQTREGYRQLVEGLNLTNALDRERYSLLIKLSGAADTYYTALEGQLKTYTDAVATAKSNLANAYRTEADALASTISKFNDFAKTLRNFRESLAVGALSTNNLGDKYRATKAQFNATAQAVAHGPGTTPTSNKTYETAVAALQGKATDFLSASMASSATAVDYARDYAKVVAALYRGEAGAGAVATDAQRQLDALNRSVDGLMVVNKSVLSVHDAILGLQAAITAMNKYQADRDAATAAANAAVARAAQARALADAAAARENQRLAGLRAAYDQNNTGAGEITGILNQLASGGVIKAAWVPQIAAEWQATASAVYGQFKTTSTASQWQQKGALLDDLLADLVNYSVGAALRHPFSYYGTRARAIEGSHKDGLAYVPWDNYRAELHKGERVLTAEEARVYTPDGGALNRMAPPSRAGGNGGADRLEQLIQALQEDNKMLREEVRMLRDDVRQGQAGIIASTKETTKQLKRWDIDGMPAVTTA